MENLIEKHINNTQKKLKKCNNLILKSKYDKYVSNILIQTYIDARYYNFGVNSKIKVFYKRIYNALEKKAEELISEEPRQETMVKNTLELFKYYFYIDYVRKPESIDDIVNYLYEMRITKLGLRSAEKDDFKNEFKKIIKENEVDLDKLEKEFDSQDFEIKIKKVTSKDNNYYYAKLNYNFDFPELFDKNVVEEVFNTEIIAEDKLFVEYPMIALKIFSEILEGNFSKIYICEFSVDLLNKKKKLEQVLQPINNEAYQDKVCLLINYDEFINNKNEIFSLIKRGFCFALETDEKMAKLSNEELQILELFKCIIVNSNDINKNNYRNVKLLEK